MAATEVRGLLRRALALWQGLLAAAGLGHAATLPEDKVETLVHHYDGGGVQASGPAVLVRKSLADRVSLSGQLYIDMVSNASIDVVTTASPFKETRKAWELGAQTVLRDSTLGLTLSRSSEPDYQADAIGFDVGSDSADGNRTLSLGYTRGHDQVGKRGTAGWIGQALHWQYRAGVTQVLGPRWLVSVNAEAIADSGLLGSPYRVARVFGAAVPERVPTTRSSRAVKLRSIGDTSAIVAASSVRAEFRHYWDNWALRADTTEIGGSKFITEGLLFDALVRLHRQGSALFYSDNARSETLYVSRNRQLSAFTSTAVGARVQYAWPGLAWGHELKLSGGCERVRYRFRDYTDLRSGQAYGHGANVCQAAVTAIF